jgi:hypothetical protein
LTGYLTDLADPIAMIAPQLVPFSRSSKYSNRGSFETLLGPTIGAAGDVTKALRGIFGPTSPDDPTPSATAADLHQIRKLGPYQSYFAFRRLLNALEGEVAEMMGLEGATPGNFVERVMRTEEARQ